MHTGRTAAKEAAAEAAACGVCGAPKPGMETPYYRGLFDAVKRIYAEEGMAAFGRGLQYRVMSHAPAVAISWTTYESIKRLLT